MNLKKIFMTKNKNYLSLVLGAISALAMPPFCAFPILFITFPILLYIFQSADNKKKAFWYGWLFGLGYFVFGLYWISNAILEYFPYFVPFAILGLPMFLSIYIGISGVLTKIVSKKFQGISLVILFSLIFGVMELIRGHFLTGFPWNLTVYTWSNYTSIMQGVRYFGIYGFSFLTIFILSLPYLFLDKNKIIKAITVNSLSIVFLVILSMLYNSKVIAVESSIDKQILFVQPSIPLNISNIDSTYVFEAYYEMTKEMVYEGVDLVVWGETAIPFPINKYPGYIDAISKILPEGTTLLTGSIRTDDEENYYNSIIAMNNKGGITATYDKSHLVPFGEYMPLREIIPLEKIVGFDFIFSKGKGAEIIKVDDMNIAMAVCYEIIFPGAIIDKKSSSKPDFIFNVSNDTFYGNSSGPHQHFAMTKAQAIANRIPIVRVGNNGISAVISKYGEVVDYIPLNSKATKLINLELHK